MLSTKWNASDMHGNEIRKKGIGKINKFVNKLWMINHIFDNKIIEGLQGI